MLKYLFADGLFIKSTATGFVPLSLYLCLKTKNMEEIPIEEFADDFKQNRFVYDSDEGLQLIIQKKVIELKSDPINSEEVREFVRERINFQITDKQWLIIDSAMGKYWNNRVPGTWICNEDLAGIIFRHCEAKKILISWERILAITNQIWEYLILKGRLLDM